MNNRTETLIKHIDHRFMPAELTISGHEVGINTGKVGSQSQMLLDDLAVILTAALKAGVEPAALLDAFGSVDEREAPITRAIISTLNEGGSDESQRPISAAR